MPASQKPGSGRRLLLLLLATVICGGLVAGVARIGSRLKPAPCDWLVHAASGLVQLQLARTPECARSLVDGWAASLAAARLSVVLDFGFIALYVWTIVRLHRWVAARRASPPRDRGRVTILAIVTAGLSDGLENVGLLAMLAGQTDGAWPPTTFGFAAVKFALLGGVLLTTAGRWLSGRRRGAFRF